MLSPMPTPRMERNGGAPMARLPANAHLRPALQTHVLLFVIVHLYEGA